MRRQTTSTMKEAIQLWLDALKMRGKYNEARLISLWEPTVGKVIAARTRDVHIYNRKLYVSLDSSVIRSELVHAKHLLLRRLNEAVGSEVIDDIIFR